ncbi:hypothetical protein ABK641_24270 [Klebsiella pneumoniae]|uniref:hypothetical protein n=1 Tax=Klebsiella pneumoniae TaxID=573 RepID=UPI0037519380
MNKRLHLITTCTRRKAGSVEDTVFPGDASLDDAFDGWYSLIAQAARRPGRVLETGELYRGAHWLRARGIAARWPGIELWAMSAGLGLRHHTDPAVAYEATFHAMPFAPATVWGSLTARPPLAGRCASLAELMQRCPDERFVIAGSPVYISAAEQDILAGVPALHDAATQLIIVTSQGYRGPLQPFLKRSRADMMATLKSNMTCLNIACAGALIDAMMQADARQAATI